MNDHGTAKTVLSKPNSVAILIHLYESGGSSKMTFIQDAVGGNYDTLKNAAKRLEDEGLIVMREVPGKSKYILVELTTLGHDVAHDLKRANDRLNGILPESETNHGSSETEGSGVRS